MDLVDGAIDRANEDDRLQTRFARGSFARAVEENPPLKPRCDDDWKLFELRMGTYSVGCESEFGKRALKSQMRLSSWIQSVLKER